MLLRTPYANAADPVQEKWEDVLSAQSTDSDHFAVRPFHLPLTCEWSTLLPLGRLGILSDPTGRNPIMSVIHMKRAAESYVRQRATLSSA